MGLLESIDKLRGHKTLIIISHSESIIKFCNEVYEISKNPCQNQITHMINKILKTIKNIFNHKLKKLIP